MSGLGNKEIMAENIKYFMDKKNKDRNSICKDLNIPYTTFSDWINAVTYPRIDKIEMLANYFGIEKSDLVEKRSKKINLEFDTVDEAMLFIIQNPTVAAYGGYDLDKMSDQDKIDFANQIADSIKFFGQKFNK